LAIAAGNVLALPGLFADRLSFEKTNEVLDNSRSQRNGLGSADVEFELGKSADGADKAVQVPGHIAIGSASLTSEFGCSIGSLLPNKYKSGIATEFVELLSISSAAVVVAVVVVAATAVFVGLLSMPDDETTSEGTSVVASVAVGSTSSLASGIDFVKADPCEPEILQA